MTIIKTNNKSKFDLEDRLVEFTTQLLHLVEEMPNTLISRHLGKQLLRSGSSPALNYGEVQAAESRADFIHKMKIILKELRETYICLKLIRNKDLLDHNIINSVFKECGELIAIFTKSIQTAKRNRH